MPHGHFFPTGNCEAHWGFITHRLYLYCIVPHPPFSMTPPNSLTFQADRDRKETKPSPIKSLQGPICRIKAASNWFLQSLATYRNTWLCNPCHSQSWSFINVSKQFCLQKPFRSQPSEVQQLQCSWTTVLWNFWLGRKTDPFYPFVCSRFLLLQHSGLGCGHRWTANPIPLLRWWPVPAWVSGPATTPTTIPPRALSTLPFSIIQPRQLHRAEVASLLQISVFVYFVSIFCGKFCYWRIYHHKCF